MKKLTLLAAAVLAAVVGCAGSPGGGRSDLSCKRGIEVAYDALSLARSQGFSGSVAWSKASALLGAAKVQEQLENYADCRDKVEKAQFYIRQSQGG